MLHKTKIIGFFSAVYSLFAVASPALAQMAYLAGEWSVDEVRLPREQSTALEAIVNGLDDTTPMRDQSENDFFRQTTRPVGKLVVETLNNEIGSCTATLIASDLVLTNAHCVVDYRGRLTAERGRLHLGWLDATREDEVRGFDVDVKNLVEVGSIAENDYAILRITSGNPSRTFGLVRLTDAVPEPGISLFIGHHPLGLPMVLSAAGNCLASGVSRGDFFHTCDTKPGSSGAPIFLVRPSSDKDDGAFAIHSRAVDENRNGGVLIASIAKESNIVRQLVRASQPDQASLRKMPQSQKEPLGNSRNCVSPQYATLANYNFPNGLSVRLPGLWRLTQGTALVSEYCQLFRLNLSVEAALPIVERLSSKVVDAIDAGAYVDRSYLPVRAKENYFVLTGSRRDEAFYQIAQLKGEVVNTLTISYPEEWGARADDIVGQIACSTKALGEPILKCRGNRISTSCGSLKNSLITYDLGDVSLLAPSGGTVVYAGSQPALVYPDCPRASVLVQNSLADDFDRVRDEKARWFERAGWWIDPSYGPSREDRGFFIYTGEVGDQYFYSLNLVPNRGNVVEVRIIMPSSWGKDSDEIMGRIACSVVNSGRKALSC